MIDEVLSRSFRLSEFVQSETATRLCIDNMPPPEELANIRGRLAIGMQRVRDCLMQPVFITSGYRSPAVNRAVRGAANSQHMLGLAADFKAPAFGMPITIVRYLMQRSPQLKYDQLIQEGDWVHISFSAAPRGEVLTAQFGPNGTTYIHGA